MKESVPNTFYRVSSKALVFDETKEKFLIIKEDNGYWELPGGGLDWGESVEENIKREVKEEMGLTVTSMNSNPSYFLIGKNMSDNESLNLVFETKIENFDDFTPTEECTEMKFVTPKEALEMNSWRNVKELAALLEKANPSA